MFGCVDAHGLLNQALCWSFRLDHNFLNSLQINLMSFKMEILSNFIIDGQFHHFTRLFYLQEVDFKTNKDQENISACSFCPQALLFPCPQQPRFPFIGLLALHCRAWLFDPFIGYPPRFSGPALGPQHPSPWAEHYWSSLLLFWPMTSVLQC